MPKRTDIESILVIGAGPIVIGQACEFDYSGTQACKALLQENYRVILINSNPATIMTDPDTADATYIEPIEWRTVARIIERERPDALLPTMGGQTALNCSLDLVRHGVLDRFQVEMIGASREAIDTAEDRERFRNAMDEIGLESPRSQLARSFEQAIELQKTIGFPTVIRPSFTLGGSGGGIVHNQEEFETISRRGLELSPVGEILIEESLLGWKEFEMEVVRDKNDNCIIVCTIENLDPMGVHTGDSITVAPAQTLTDKEYQRMRDASIAVLRRIGVDTGGANVQFAVDPKTGRLMIIEMNPRVSRSSALASKATGFPIAKVAAKLAIGYTLDELRNEITQGATPASFEPAIDYIVTKVPRFTFEKFPDTPDQLGTQMQSVGEAMAIGRTFKESLQKALRSLETGMDGLTPQLADGQPGVEESIRSAVCSMHSRRLWYIADGFRLGWSIDEMHQSSLVDPWFLSQVKQLVDTEAVIAATVLEEITEEQWRKFKSDGFADSRIATLLGVDECAVAARRRELGVRPVYKRVDTCAGEFHTETVYLYSTYEQECEARPSRNKKLIVLGSGPNRIGQGIEFDYCCVHAALALREAGYETIMVNCNPETVSTDYDTSDRLYFEPLVFEDIMEIIHKEQPDGILVQYGGQTPLKLAARLAEAGACIIGTSPDSIDLAEDRERFQSLIANLGLMQPRNAIAHTTQQAVARANTIGYPLVVRPSYVLGGRAMTIVHARQDLEAYMSEAVRVSEDAPVLLDHFLSDAVEIDVDAVCDGEQVLVAGIMQHIEQAGIHSGDSACSLPPYHLDQHLQQEIARQTNKLALALGVIGLMNVQFAVQSGQIHVLEANPRASRTVPFVSKSTGLALAKVAALCMIGRSLRSQGIAAGILPPRKGYYAVKEAVFPFARFSGVDPLLGPEMKSTGEVMGIGHSFGEAFGKAQNAAGNPLPRQGAALVSVRDADKPAAVQVARLLVALGFEIFATSGTAQALSDAGIACKLAHKVKAGKRPHIVDKIKSGELALIVNTTEGKRAIIDSATIRREAVQNKVCYTTTVSGARAIIEALSCEQDLVYSLEDVHGHERRMAGDEH